MPLKNTMWIMVPDPDSSKEPWVGQITRDVAAQSSWVFELVRLVDLDDLYRLDPFHDDNNVVGLLDHQKPCTLIWPIINYIDRGKMHVKNKSQRIIIRGVFHALLSDIPAPNDQEQIFLGIHFESESLDAWYSTPTFSHNFDYATKIQTLDIKPSVIIKFIVEGLGHVTITRNARVESKLRSSYLRSATIFKIDFAQSKSIIEVMNLSFGLERLFGFLVGFRGTYPIFTTWVANKIKSGDTEWNYDGTLEIGNVEWSEGETPHPLSCIHLNGVAGTELPSILARFFAQGNDIVDRIHAVEFSRFFSRNLNDRFAATMPVIDSYVQSRYKTSEDESYIQAQKDFFTWIDASPLEVVREFSKKHVSIKDNKAPSLKILLMRAIEFVNNKGFCFPPEIADQIQKRRGKLFHAAPQMETDEILRFSLEVRAISGLLLLHTLEDLGINISYLAEHFHALNDLKPFMKARK